MKSIDEAMYQSIAMAPTDDVNISEHENRFLAIAKFRQLLSNISVHQNRNLEVRKQSESYQKSFPCARLRPTIAQKPLDVHGGPRIPNPFKDESALKLHIRSLLSAAAFGTTCRGTYRRESTVSLAAFNADFTAWADFACVLTISLLPLPLTAVEVLQCQLCPSGPG
jgi:hypothetical protein